MSVGRKAPETGMSEVNRQLDNQDTPLPSTTGQMAIFERELKAQSSTLAHFECQTDGIQKFKLQQREQLQLPVADLLIRFVRIANARLHNSQHLLIPSSTHPDRFQVATFHQAAAAIPKEAYEEWGLPNRCRSFVINNIVRVSLPIKRLSSQREF